MRWVDLACKGVGVGVGVGLGCRGRGRRRDRECAEEGFRVAIGEGLRIRTKDSGRGSVRGRRERQG